MHSKEFYDCPVDARDCFAYDYGFCNCLVPSPSRKVISFGKQRDCPFYKNIDDYRRDRADCEMKQKTKGVKKNG